jgi:hypothetical protein
MSLNLEAGHTERARPKSRKELKMSRQKFLLLMTGLTSALLLVSCGGQQTVPAQVSPAPTSAPVLIAASPTPIPPKLTPVLPTATLIPTPTTGIIKGKLVHYKSKKALGNRAVLLHPTCETAKGEIGVELGDKRRYLTQLAIISETKSDEQGFFLFKEVPPGFYALSAVIDLPLIEQIATVYTTDGKLPSDQFLNASKDMKGLCITFAAKVAIISVKAGETVDLKDVEMLERD